MLPSSAFTLVASYRATEGAGSCETAPKKPMTRAKAEEIQARDEVLGLDALARELFAQRRRRRLGVGGCSFYGAELIFVVHF